MVRTALTDCRILSGSGFIEQHALLLHQGAIQGIVASGRVPADAERVALGGRCVGPAFVDLHVNGGGGVLFNHDPTLAGLKAIAAAHARCGTLGILPTLMTGSAQGIVAAVVAVRAAAEAGMTSVLGLHLEGPYISPAMKGAHDESLMRPLTDRELHTILLPSRDVLRIITVSPGMVRPGQVAALADAGIVVLIGHTDASSEETAECLAAGAAGATHLFNAMPPMTGRAPGAVGAALAAPQAWVTIIADGHHVHPTAIAAVKRAKGDRLVLVSDAMPPLGQGDGEFSLGEHRIACTGGRCRRPDGGLAGSAVDLAGGVSTCVQRCGIPLDEAWRMASTYPAGLLGRRDLGAVAAGMPANLVMLDDDLTVAGVIERGVVRARAADGRIGAAPAVP